MVFADARADNFGVPHDSQRCVRVGQDAVEVKRILWMLGFVGHETVHPLNTGRAASH